MGGCAGIGEKLDHDRNSKNSPIQGVNPEIKASHSNQSSSDTLFSTSSEKLPIACTITPDVIPSDKSIQTNRNTFEHNTKIWR